MTETTTVEEDTDPVQDLLAGAALLVIVIGLIAVLVTVFYGFAYEFTDDAQVTTESASGVIETVEAPDGRSFVITFEPALKEGGPTELSVIGPTGEIKHRTALAPGVQKVEFPQEDRVVFPIEYESGSYRIVATHGNEVYGKATVDIKSESLLPFVPLTELFNSGMAIGVFVVVVLIGGVVRGD